MTDIAAARHPDEWRDLPRDEPRIIVGRLLHADWTLIQIASPDAKTFNIEVVPPMFSELDMFMNMRMMPNVPRAIKVRATTAGWSADLADVFVDVDGHCIDLEPDMGPAC